MALAVLITCLSAALLWVTFDRNFYSRMYQDLGVPEDLRVDLATLMGYTEVLLDYLEGRVSSPNVDAVVRGRVGPLYGEREVKHLVDVRELIALAFLIRNIGAVVVLLLLFFAGVAGDLSKTAKAYKYGLAAISVFLIGMAIVVALDFTHYFTVFHLIAFDNDLWLLDPATEFLIRMVPEPFFIAAAQRIVVLALVMFAVLSGFFLTVGVTLPVKSQPWRQLLR